MFRIKDFPEELAERANAPLLSGILRGIERECLRVAPNGDLSFKPHPSALGSALTHSMITTDFSEALLEFITSPTHRLDDLFNHLDQVHRFTINAIGEERLWLNSMPASLPEDENTIPLAQYGSSNTGLMKTAYRRGLGHRYGRSMQTVAGLHYNFSLPSAFWAHFLSKEHSTLSLEKYRDQGYFGLIRNFRRHYWLLILLFGASPAISNAFVGNRRHDLEQLPNKDGWFKPYATSLRMGDLGYQSSAQDSLFVCYNDKNTYISTLRDAILSPFDGYKNIPVAGEDGVHHQLSQGLLQIENEFYSSIRPKRSAQSGETALTALHYRGVEYIEVRCLDINPFEPLGINKAQARFLDTFLLYCALAESPLTDMAEWKSINNNQKKVVNEGRDPKLTLQLPSGEEIKLAEWANALFDAMKPAAQLLDTVHNTGKFSLSLDQHKELAANPELTPSARMLQPLLDGANMSESAATLSAALNEKLKSQPLSASDQKRFEDASLESLALQKDLEGQDQLSFEDFLNNYFKQYEKL